MSNSGDLKYGQISQIFLIDIFSLFAVIILLAIHTDKSQNIYNQCKYLKILQKNTTAYKLQCGLRHKFTSWRNKSSRFYDTENTK